jgi:putative NADPH-quinone reductase
MGQRILVINGHPDPRPERLCAALASAYAAGAQAAGREVRRIDVGALDISFIRTAADFDAAPGTPFAEAQQAILWADHLVIVHPLWVAGVPAMLKAFLEQVFRYGFAIPKSGGRRWPLGLLKGRSARMVVTLGMPAPIYRLVFGAFGTRAVERGVLWFSGIRPVRRTLIGGAGELSPAGAKKWMDQMRRLGARGL